MPELFQWNLVMRQDTPLGVGVVSGHPKLTEGLDIHTSQILRAEEMCGGLVLETASGNTYQLKLEEWRPTPWREDSLCPEQLGLPPDFWTRYAQAKEKASKAEKADLQLCMRPGTLFLRIVDTYVLSSLWMGKDSRIRDAAVGIHLGMFQDSCLVKSECEGPAESDRADLRVFPMRNRLEPYHISQGIKFLLVCNEGRTDVAFGFEKKQVLCAAKTNTLISTDDFDWVIPRP